MEAILPMSTGLLELSITLNVTVGAAPGAAPSTCRIFVTSPGSDAEFSGMRCAPGIEASKSIEACEVWQPLHCLSSICGRFKWLAPVAKFTSSWQEPHTAALGFVFQLSAWVAIPFDRPLQDCNAIGPPAERRLEQLRGHGRRDLISISLRGQGL